MILTMIMKRLKPSIDHQYALLLILMISLTNHISNDVCHAISANHVEQSIDCSPFQALLHSNSNINLTTNCNCTYKKNPNQDHQPNTLYHLNITTSNSSYNVMCSSRRISGRLGYGVYIRELHMNNKNLSGNLTWMITSSNFMNDLVYIDLSQNKFVGQIPAQMWSSMQSLTYLNLSSNRLQGTIAPYDHDDDDKVSQNSNLTNSSTSRQSSSNSSYNHNRLESLDLSGNNLSGPFHMRNDEAVMHLKELNVSHNDLQLMNLNQSLVIRFNGLSSFLPNLNCTGWCGGANDTITPSPWPWPWPSPAPQNHHSPKLEGLGMAPSSPHYSHYYPTAPKKTHRFDHFMLLHRSGAMIFGIIGAVSALVLIAIAILLLLHLRRRHRSSRPAFASVSSAKKKQKKKKTTMAASSSSSSSITSSSTLIPFYYNVSRNLGNLRGSSFDGLAATIMWMPEPNLAAAKKDPVESLPDVVMSADPASIPVTIFRKPLLDLSLADLLRATESFSREHEIIDSIRISGPGSDSRCWFCTATYKCLLPGVSEDGSAELAIEVLVSRRFMKAAASSSDREEEEEKVVVKLLSAMAEVRHENLVPLLGYCLVGGDIRLLIYRYIDGGRSLEDLLEEEVEEEEPGEEEEEEEGEGECEGEGGILDMVMIESKIKKKKANGAYDYSNLDDWSTMDTWRPQDLMHNDDMRSRRRKKKKKISQLGWSERVKIALGVARAAAYLHARRDAHGALSSGCVIIRMQEPRPAMSGCETEAMPRQSSVAEVRVAGYGALGIGGGTDPPAWKSSQSAYVAPEHRGANAPRGPGPGPESHGHETRGTATCADKWDVYSIGVIMMELVSGTPSLGGTYPQPFTSLVGWVHHVMKDKSFHVCPIDASLPSSCHGYALHLLHMAYLCTAQSPAKRPSVHQLVGLLKDLEHANL